MPKKGRNFDEFNFGEDEFNDMENNLNTKAFYGVRCPRQGCAVCRDVSSLWDKHRDAGYGQQDDSKYSKRARKFGAKKLIYLNVVFPDKPSEVRIMECGIKMQRAIVDGIRRQGWGNVVHPKEGMTIKVIRSEDSGFPSYIPSPDIAKGKRALEDMSVLDRMYELDNIDELRSEVEIFKINSIKDSVTFDILPGWEPDRRHIFYFIAYYHFNVSPDALEAGITGNISEDVADKIVDEDRSETATETKVDTTPPDWDKEGDWGENKEAPSEEGVKEAPKATLENPPKCFGLFYEEDDEGCQEATCDLIREECKKRTYKSAK